MKYCENCRALCQHDVCDICESAELREVLPEDYCILTECAEDFGGLLKNTLEDMDIPCALMPFGNGARSAFGLSLGKYRVFVQYRDYETSKDVLDQLTYDPTEDLRKDLLDNREKWHINGFFAKRRMRRKFQIAKEEDLIDFVARAVGGAAKITDDGAISDCPEGGHYIAVMVNDRKLWLNSATYEILT